MQLKYNLPDVLQTACTEEYNIKMAHYKFQK
jgi:hypothetical protein